MNSPSLVLCLLFTWSLQSSGQRIGSCPPSLSEDLRNSKSCAGSLWMRIWPSFRKLRSNCKRLMVKTFLPLSASRLTLPDNFTLVVNDRVDIWSFLRGQGVFAKPRFLSCIRKQA